MSERLLDEGSFLIVADIIGSEFYHDYVRRFFQMVVL